MEWIGKCDMFVVTCLLWSTIVGSVVGKAGQCPSGDTEHVYWNKGRMSIENMINQLQTDVSSLKRGSESRRKINHLKRTISHLRISVNKEKENGERLNKRVENLENSVNKVEGMTTRETSEIRETLDLIGGDVTLLKSRQAELVHKVKEDSDNTLRRDEQLNKDVQDAHSTIVRMQRTTDDQKESIEILSRDILEAQQNLSHVSNMLSEVTKLVKYCEQKIPDLDSKLSLNKLTIQEIIAYGKLFFCCLLFIGLCVAVYRRRTRLPHTETETPIPTDNSEHRKSEQRTHTQENPSVIYNQAPAQMTRFTRRTLENSVGVVSFDKHKSDFHKDLIEGLPSTASLSIRVQRTIVTREDEIQTIPPSKVVFVFVEANSRHIILEDPTQEIGWFRKQTVEAVLEMGCDVFVLYVRDEEVENDSLYHSRLRSVDRHQILSTLKGRNRVLSLNLSFSVYQKKFLISELQSAFR